ncbi:hypothetical protein, variant 1 [Aphanomyces astaci]|uniref:Uncharacterized protein n=2 Tax=Aphanomyces astaci TaxID=112090 RepID=W4GMZ3_APHAT|nr:hypothetical protein, variant 1 [Aphanomyces astaci]ETV80736.1 hypothetical protein, variant 1 [Aphanomyces astaci]|eukprot:XP_009829684.1 hypothetical protein, variant 1 [Aphanomyces astaci]
MPSKPGTGGESSFAHGVHQRLQRLGSTKVVDVSKPPDLASRSKENRSTSVSRSGSLHSVLKSTKHSVSNVGRKPLKGHTDVKLLMADVFAEMDRQRLRGAVKFPLKFADFFDHEMMFDFVKACMQLADSFVLVQQLERTAPPRSPPLPQQPPHHHAKPPAVVLAATSSLPDAERTLAYHKAVSSHSDSVANLAKSYSRLVLHCSNFERHEEDRTFFEAVYYFVCAIVKTNHPQDSWPLLEEELGYAFRGEVFNANGKSNLRPPVVPEPAKAPAMRFGQPTIATDSAEPAGGDLKFLGGAPTVYGSYGQNVALTSIVSRVDATKSRAEHNIKASQAMRGRIHVQRNDNHKARLQLGTLSQDTPYPRAGLCRTRVHSTQRPPRRRKARPPSRRQPHKVPVAPVRPPTAAAVAPASAPSVVPTPQ